MKKSSIFLLALVGLSLSFVAIPVYVVRPFRAQSAGPLAFSLEVARWAPLVTALCFIFGAMLSYFLWSSLKWKGKSITMFSVVLLALFALAARVNIYEKMFHPISGAQFIAASQAKLDANDMVMAVRIGPQVDSRAYPIRTMAYHHLINDVVANEPIVATY